MKSLFLIRHAKSSWDEPGLTDQERPLNKRGLRDAPFMAKLLLGKALQVDGIVSSPAKRARDTAAFFARECNIPATRIWIDPNIYHGSPAQILAAVRQFSNEWETALLFGHNPALTSLINLFAKEYLANLPTCGIARLESGAELWTGFGEADTSMAELYYPKQFFS